MRQLLTAALLRAMRRPFVQNRLRRRLLRGRAADSFASLLNGMRLMFVLDRDFRRNLEGFNGRILFRDEDSSFAVSATFEKRRMTVARGDVDGGAHRTPNAVVIFRDEQALRDALAAEHLDLLNALLTQTIRVEGNLNYLYKFAFMANHLQRALMPSV